LEDGNLQQLAKTSPKKFAEQADALKRLLGVMRFSSMSAARALRAGSANCATPWR
jgi:hypothetical protein